MLNITNGHVARKINKACLYFNQLFVYQDVFFGSSRTHAC